MTELDARFILGLDGSFSSEDLKRAYRKTAGENHPDRGGDPERMRLVNEAYSVLKHPPSSLEIVYVVASSRAEAKAAQRYEEKPSSLSDYTWNRRFEPGTVPWNVEKVWIYRTRIGKAAAIAAGTGFAGAFLSLLLASWT
jgi:hypothetical protein